MGHWEQIAAARLREEKNPPPRWRRILDKIGFAVFALLAFALFALQAYVLLAPFVALLLQ